MALVGWPLQFAEEAEREKGELTDAPLAGLATLGSPEEDVLDVDESDDVPDELTVRATSLTQEAPWFPQAFTCSV